MDTVDWNETLCACVCVCPVLPVQLDVLRGPERLPADEQLQEMLRGKLHLLQSDSTKLDALLKVPLVLQKKREKKHINEITQLIDIDALTLAAYKCLYELNAYIF